MGKTVANLRQWLRAGIALAMLAVSASPAAASAVLATPPYLGSQVASGWAQCVAVNVGPVPLPVTITMYDDAGNALSGPVSLIALPHRTIGAPLANLSFQNATTCTFAVGSKKPWRASLFVSPTALGSGSDAVVVPAQSP